MFRLVLIITTFILVAMLPQSVLADNASSTLLAQVDQQADVKADTKADKKAAKKAAKEARKQAKREAKAAKKAQREKEKLANKKDRRVCKRERVTGSRIPEKVCRKESEWERIAERARENVERAREGGDRAVGGAGES